MSRGLPAGFVGVALILAAALLGSVALFAFALGLVVVVDGSLAAVAFGARRVVVERSVPRTEVLEGRPLHLRYEVRGLAPLPVHLEARDGHGAWRRVADSWSRTIAIGRPGPHLLGPTEVRVRDDLGLFSRRLRVGDPTPVLALPTPAPVGIGPGHGGVEPGGDPEPDGLQPYSRSTPVARIHWPSVARGGEWQERRVVTAPRIAPLVVVDLSGATCEEAIDWALRAAAGQVHGLALAGGCRVLLPGERLPVPVENVAAGWPAMHRRLALLRGTVERPASPTSPGALYIRAADAPALGLPGGPTVATEAVLPEELTSVHA